MSTPPPDPTPSASLLAEQGRLLRRLAREIVGDRPLADDLAQDAWLRTRRSVVPSKPGSFWATVLRNLIRSRTLSESTRSERERRSARSEALPAADDTLERAELLTRVAQAVQDLPDPYRAVVLERFWDGLAPREIARRRGVPVATVQSQLHRGLQRLRHRLSDSQGRFHPALVAFAWPTSPPGFLTATLLMQGKGKLIATVLLLLASWGAWRVVLRSPEGAAVSMAEPLAQEPSDRTLLGPARAAASSLDDGLAERGPQAPDRTSVPLVAPHEPALLVRGRVVRRHGEPIAQATLAWTRTGEQDPALQLHTQADGTYQGHVPEPGTYDVLIQASGFLPWEGSLTLLEEPDGQLQDRVLLPGRTLRGRVQHASGKPFPQAEIVRVQRPHPMRAPRLHTLAHSAADGSFELPDLPLSSLVLGILAPGVAPEVLRIPAHAPDSRSEHVISLTPGWSANVRVQGVAQARGALRLVALPTTGSALADDEFDWEIHTRRSWPVTAEGVVTLSGLVPGERYYVQAQEARSDGTWDSRGSIATVSADQPEAEWSYPAPARIHLQVHDAETGLPLPSAVVSNVRKRTIDPEVQAFPGATPGSYQVEPPVDRSITLQVHALGYRTRNLASLSLAAGEVKTLQPVALTRAASCTVEVYDAHTSEPVPGVSLTLIENPASPQPLRRPVQTTDSQGIAVLTLGAEPSAGTRPSYKLRVERDGYVPLTLEPLPEERPLLVNLLPAAQARLRVRDEQGLPVARVQVTCRAEEATQTRFTDAEGLVVFRDLAPGDYGFSLLQAQLTGRRILSGGSLASFSIMSDRPDPSPALEATLHPGINDALTLVVPARVQLQGRVLLAGQPLAGAEVHLIPRRVGLQDILGLVDLGEPQTTTDAQGQFLQRALPAGPTTIFLRHPGQAFPHLVFLELEAPEESTTIRWPTTSFTARILDPTGNPIPEASLGLTLRGPDGSYTTPPSLLTADIAGIHTFHQPGTATHTFPADLEGYVSIPNPPPDYQLRLEARAPNALPQVHQLALTPGEHASHDFTLQPAGQLTVQLQHPDGTAPLNRFVQVTYEGSTTQPPRRRFQGSDPVFRFPSLHPGPWIIEVTDLYGSTPQAEERVQVEPHQLHSQTLLIPWITPEPESHELEELED